MQDRTRRCVAATLWAIGSAGALPSDAHAATRGFSITSFDAIRVEAPVTVNLITGKGASARAEGDADMLERLRLDVSGRLLVVRAVRAASNGGGKSGGRATISLSTGMLDRIILVGGGSITVNRLAGLRAEIVSGGNGDVAVAAVAVDQLNVALAGGGKVALAGRAGTATIRVTGPGSVAAEGLHIRNATVGNEGPGSIRLDAAVTAKVTASGAGDVIVTGKAACIVVNRGTGRIACGGEDY
ncbi:MAG: DUF2807 domain-containing protein [Sphingobium sp.]